MDLNDLDTIRLRPGLRHHPRQTQRACTGCGRRIPAGPSTRCATCPPASPTYDAAHNARRAHLLPHAIGTPCPLCGLAMNANDKLDLDHTTGQITHASCNRRAGAAITNAA